ncbi:MAG: DedA family protein [Proteobacteria bacterium]|nr:DedA family protein [Pseudomonadota bacterium]
MLKSLYDWAMNLAGHRFATRWLALISFIESSVFPIPPDVLLVPMALAERNRSFYFAGICTVASVLGGFLGYAIGYFLWDTLGAPLFEFYGYMDEFDSFKDAFNERGAWLVLIFGVTFFPYKVITIASGVTMLDPLVFGLASVVARFIRFFVEAALIWWFGEAIREFIEKRLVLVVSGVVFLVVAGFVGIGYFGK